MVSGGFDPVHIGHIRMILDAAQYGDVVVVANSDDWLYRKKGFVFMEFEQRAEILASIKGVVKVSGVDDSDTTVCEAIRRLKPDIFANGGDRKEGGVPEDILEDELGVIMAYNIGGGKVESSSELIKKAELSSKN